MKIYLNDLLRLSDTELKNTKIRLNQSNNHDFDPIQLFKNKDMQLYNGQFYNYGSMKSFQQGQIAIGLLRLDSEKWLLFDISRITKDLNLYDSVGYEYETLHQHSKYFGRTIIRYKNHSQQMIRNAIPLIKECIVFEVISETFDDSGFPGYENVDLSWDELKRVVQKNDWRTALENQKGVYLITDTITGKRYVGSAYGENMLLGRWENYVRNGHGGNKDLKDLSFDYIKGNFRFSILDIYKSTVDDSTIIRREHHWMKILLTKDKTFGYNN
ncbi:MAG: GIY-YIG nuclease family protein [Spirochaetales bacterium]|nr:GIY-YIG nuclease family protein [Spirochaetales bacterium]